MGSKQLEGQWNKVYGIGNHDHHRNSDRLVFRYNIKADLFEIAEYFYIDGKGPYVRELGMIDGKGNEFEVKTRAYWFGRELNGYFGGKASAPQDVKIKVEILK